MILTQSEKPEQHETKVLLLPAECLVDGCSAFIAKKELGARLCNRAVIHQHAAPEQGSVAA